MNNRRECQGLTFGVVGFETAYGETEISLNLRGLAEMMFFRSGRG